MSEAVKPPNECPPDDVMVRAAAENLMRDAREGMPDDEWVIVARAWLAEHPPDETRKTYECTMGDHEDCRSVERMIDCACDCHGTGRAPEAAASSSDRCQCGHARGLHTKSLHAAGGIGTHDACREDYCRCATFRARKVTPKAAGEALSDERLSQPSDWSTGECERVQKELLRCRADVERLNHMLRDTHGYGQGPIDAYVAQCEELDGLRAQLADMQLQALKGSSDSIADLNHWRDKALKAEAQLAALPVQPPASAETAELDAIIESFPVKIRSRESNGPENLIASLVLTIARFKHDVADTIDRQAAELARVRADRGELAKHLRMVLAVLAVEVPGVKERPGYVNAAESLNNIEAALAATRGE